MITTDAETHRVQLPLIIQLQSWCIDFETQFSVSLTGERAPSAKPPALSLGHSLSSSSEVPSALPFSCFCSLPLASKNLWGPAAYWARSHATCHTHFRTAAVTLPSAPTPGVNQILSQSVRSPAQFAKISHMGPALGVGAFLLSRCHFLVKAHIKMYLAELRRWERRVVLSCDDPWNSFQLQDAKPQLHVAAAGNCPGRVQSAERGRDMLLLSPSKSARAGGWGAVLTVEANSSRNNLAPLVEERGR